jgi:hypothetical protein
LDIPPNIYYPTQYKALFTTKQKDESMPSLYEISKELNALEALLIESDGEIPDDAFEQHLDATTEQRDEKLASYCKLIRNLEARASVRQAEADTFRQEANRLDTLAEADLKAVEKLKERLKWFWQAHNLGKIEAGGFRIALQANGGVAPLQFTDDLKPEDADERFHKVIPARVDWDKDAVRKALQAGEGLTFAKLGERGYRIVIK